MSAACGVCWREVFGASCLFSPQGLIKVVGAGLGCGGQLLLPWNNVCLLSLPACDSLTRVALPMPDSVSKSLRKPGEKYATLLLHMTIIIAMVEI